MKKKPYLVQGACWRVSAPPDFDQFLRTLPELVPPGSILTLEGCDTPQPLRSFLLSRIVDATTEIPKGTLLPTSDVFNIPATFENVGELADLLQASPTTTVPTHLQVHCGGILLLQWFDASAGDPFFISKDLPRDKVSAYCHAVGAELTDWEQAGDSHPS